MNELSLHQRRLALDVGKPDPVLIRDEMFDQAAECESLVNRYNSRQDAGPTPETKRRERPDPITALEASKDWCHEYSRVVSELREVWTALSGGLMPSASEMGMRVDISRQSYGSVIEGLSERMARKWNDNYQPWSEAMEKAAVTNSNVVGLSAIEVCYDVIWDGVALRDIDRTYGLTNGTSASSFRWAVHHYAQAAGWIDRERARIGA